MGMRGGNDTVTTTVMCSAAAVISVTALYLSKFAIGRWGLVLLQGI